ncbi:MAG: hypothetical protein GY772_28880 [bacterium]|nr:hypothetical protein [bacterium]
MDPRPPVPVAGGAAGGVRQSWRQQLAPAATVEGLLQLDLGPHPRTLMLSADAQGPVVFTVHQRWQRSSEPPRQYPVAPGGSIEIPVAGSIRVDAVNTNAGNPCWVELACYAYGAVQNDAPIDAYVGGLVETGPGVPGAWVALGWSPPHRSSLSLIPNNSTGIAISPIDIGFRDLAGVFQAHTRIVNPTTVQHPPTLELLARHPGDNANPIQRGLTAVWWRG